MRGVGGWAVAGLVGLVAVIATPATAHGSAAPVEVLDTVKARAVRWVIAARVRLRGGPSAEAPVLGGVEVNTSLELKAMTGDWCEVERADGTRGFVACRFLGEEPLDLAAIANAYDESGDRNPQYDPARAFALQPSWDTLQTYALELDKDWREDRAIEVDDTLPARRDATLERMKAELAKGAYGARPAPRDGFEKLQRVAAETSGDDVPDTVRAAAAEQVRMQLQLWSEPFGEEPERALAVVASLELPPLRPSYFATEGALAAPGDDPEALSGRFGIVHRYVTTPAPREGEEAQWAFYDMSAVTHLLVRPLQRVQLFADGRMTSTPSLARDRRTLSAYLDHPMCEGWTPGFAYGDLDPRDPAWGSYEDYWPRAYEEAGKPPGSLYAFYLPAPPPNASATVSLREQRLDPVATGFTGATTRVFDLDHDATPDLLVWEARGPGPGHLDGPTTTQDTWYRLVLANVGGEWKILGIDEFSYGCGC